MSVQPVVFLGAFEIPPPVVVCSSGPVCASGQHVAVEVDAESEMKKSKM